MQTQPPESGPKPSDLKQVGRYRIVRPLSKGGMALVYEARRESLAGVSPRVAIKLILPEHANSDTFQELFINEARLGASMHHQNLVQIQDFDRDGDHFYLVMEYVEGLTLRRIISLCARAGVAIPLGVIAEIGRQASDGLDYAHRAHDEHGRHLGLVHRDIKPSNLILNPQGVAKILDFGISKGHLMRERKGAVKGTWGYMAPEQAVGHEVHGTADVFGLGTVLYELASLKPLFKQKKPAEIKGLLVDDHAARMAATLDPSYGPLVGVLVRALQRDPAARYGTARELGRALSSLLPDPITARDEVVRFLHVLRALDEGKPVPPSALYAPIGTSPPGVSGPHASRHTPPPSHGSIAHTGVDDGLGTGLILAGAAALVIGLVVVAGAGLMLTVGGRSPAELPAHSPPQIAVQADVAAPEKPAASEEPAALDEPPGPAGEDAPGEQAPAPKAKRTRRPPPKGSVGSQPSEPPTRTRSDALAGLGAAEDKEVVLHIDRTASEAPPDAEAADPVADPAPAPEAHLGQLTLFALPAGLEYEIWIDGQFVKAGPVMRYELPAGEHTVTITALDGRRKKVTLVVPEGSELRKSWDFDRGQWRR